MSARVASDLAAIDLFAVGHLVAVVRAGYARDDLPAIPTHDGIGTIL
jgi:hypothetical protein